MLHAANKSLLTAAMLIVALLMLAPLVITVTNSFMSENEIAVNYDAIGDDAAAGEYANLKWIPDLVTLEQFQLILLDKPQFLSMFWNSVMLTVPIVAGQTIVASMAAFAFAKLRFPGRDGLFFLYIITMLLPFQVTLVPNFIAMDALGLLNTYPAIILPGIFSAFGVFLLRQFMSHIPWAYVEAAKVDGAGYVTIFMRVMIPMTMPGIAAMQILVFVDNWNMVEQPLLFLQDALMQPLSVYLSRINEGDRGVAFAAASLYMTPIVFLYLHGENELIQGIQLSGIKG
ncbi:carbohydrate ABC transporter permease [Paenibacillus sp. H1-7]|uniref:carbohydrate ABC transporter permease n=1 Tax=Paenibacillus sp. H1-7 TaxID=2282849 RepID=UPI001EF9A8FD|nr:carbohydrate ABC transporter permease [Paenibacillus sp. H1-7]ULL19835.1 carbohydrate ABC transporter permease [Paenibacillus sp. H1-7]